jgi:GNAT superfamily N-acetyltransferase
MTPDHVTLRIAGPADAALLAAYLRGLSPMARRQRFLGAGIDGTCRLPEVLADPRRTVIVAEQMTAAGRRIIGEAELFAAGGVPEAEFALSVADHATRRGLGSALLDAVTLQARRRGCRALAGEALRLNDGVRRFARAAGFALTESGDWQTVRLVRPLAAVRVASEPDADVAAGMDAAADAGVAGDAAGEGIDGHRLGQRIAEPGAGLEPLRIRRRPRRERAETGDRGPQIGPAAEAGRGGGPQRHVEPRGQRPAVG